MLKRKYILPLIMWGASFFPSICCFFLLLLSLHLFFAKQGIKVLNRLLSIVFFTRFGQLLIYINVNSQDSELFPFFYQLFTPLYYAFPVCFYLYVSYFVNGRAKLRQFEWLHFIPVFLAVVHVLPFPFLPTIDWNFIADQIKENKQLFITERSGLFPAWFYYVGRPFLQLVYLTATWYAVLKSDDTKITAAGKSWIMFFLKAATFFQLISFLPLIIWNMQEPLINVIFILLNCLTLLAIIVFVMHQPKLLYGYLLVAVDLAKDGEESTKDIHSAKKIKLLSDQVFNYSVAMKSYMERKSPYLESDFQIGDLAKELDIPVHHCSFVINNLLGKNFRDWINSYRIVFFIACYPLKSDKMTIEAIAYESGFKSLATFYNAFKKETGLMPKTYFFQQKVL